MSKLKQDSVLKGREKNSKILRVSKHK